MDIDVINVITLQFTLSSTFPISNYNDRLMSNEYERQNEMITQWKREADGEQ